MAAWRLYLTDQAVRRLDMMPGKPNVLAAWTGPRRVSFFDLRQGTHLGERAYDGIVPPERTGDAWESWVQGFRAPNATPLPVVRAQTLSLHLNSDGSTRLLHDDASGDLLLNTPTQQVRLHRETETTFVAVAMDRVSGLIAALDTSGRLHTYKRDVRLAIVDLGLAVEDWQPNLALPATGTTVLCCNGQSLFMADASGQLKKKLDLHYRPGPITCSPDGKAIAVTDADVGVIRVYNAELQATHQRFAADLLADARRVQLLGGSSSSTAMLSALALNNRGVIAFALGGMVCVSNLSRMTAIPRE